MARKSKGPAPHELLALYYIEWFDQEDESMNKAIGWVIHDSPVETILAPYITLGIAAKTPFDALNTITIQRSGVLKRLPMDPPQPKGGTSIS